MHSPLRVARLPFVMASWGRVKTGALWNLLAFGLAVASWWRVSWPSCLCSLFKTRRCELMVSELVLLPILYFFFPSFLGVLSSIPTQMGKVRQIKRNRVIITYLSTFPSITCETSNESALNIQLKYYFVALITLLIALMHINYKW